MSSDRSRRTDDPRYGYTGVVAQQGRVILDRDFNALQALTADRIDADALDFVGPCGTPDDGFRITLPASSPPAPPLWSPPAGWQGSPPGSPGDFDISPGIMYVGGKRVTFPAEQNGKIITYSYLDQPDWPAPPPPTDRLDYELMLLELTELEVGAAEDSDMLEVALGGPDTTQRIKLLRRVRRMSVKGTTCAEAWAEAIQNWAQLGWDFDPDTMQLLPQALLKVGFTQDTSSGNPCDPVATGGYLGADNQLIRLKIAGSGSRLIWSYDNASFLYRITAVSSDGTTLTLAADPPDAFHVPQTDQLVEILSTAAVLTVEPDESDQTGKGRILRVAAEPGGLLRNLAQQYGPVGDNPKNQIVLDTALPQALRSSPLPLFLRVWQASLPLTLNSPITIADPTTGISTGVTATISLPAGGRPPDGAFWQIAVRPSTPQGAYPEDLLTAPQPPDGLRRWVCPLALIQWSARSGPQITDCRTHFQPLSRLGCCTVSIRPADLTGATLQSLIDRAAAWGTPTRPVTVCLRPGTYLLPGSLYLDQRHAGMTLQSCGGPVTFAAQKPIRDLASFADGLVVIEGAAGVTLRGLTFVPPIVPRTRTFFAELLQGASRDAIAQASQAIRPPYTCFGIRAADSTRLTIADCAVEIALNNSDDVLNADLFAAAIFLQGNCSSLNIDACAASSAIAPTYTRLALRQSEVASVPPAALTKFNDLMLLELPPPASPPASLPPPSSPPTETALLRQRASDAIELVAAKRTAVAATSPRPTVVTVGVLAAGDCFLDQSKVCDSQFDALTFATWFSSYLSTVRLQDNTVINGVAGLWLEVVGAAFPQMWAPGSPNYDRLIKQFEEYELLIAIAGQFPLPMLPGSTPRAEAPPPPQAEFSLSVTGNQIELRQQLPNAGVSAALMLALYSEADPQPLTSVIVSANRLCGGMWAAPVGSPSHASGVEVPAAQITLLSGTPCAITGNVVINKGVRMANGMEFTIPSLWVTIGGNSDAGMEQLAATGNVLQGLSDLAQLRRRNNADWPWSPKFNADPS